MQPLSAETSERPDTTAGLTDRDLLRRFVQDADKAAFTEIVQRHQGLVISVCKRVIGTYPDIDDAFQATFLALARRPRQIRRAESLSSWLYSVAWRVSVRLVRQRKKHPVQALPEDQPGREPDPLQQITFDRESLILDEELNSLSAKYRDVLVMTYFADRTSQQIADELNVSKGTVDGRIRQARNLLRVRLARRGVALGMLATVAAVTSKSATAGVPAPLMGSTIELGTQTLNGALPGTTDLSHLEPLIRSEMTMLTTKTIIASVIGLCAVAGIAGLSSAASRPDARSGDDDAVQIDSADVSPADKSDSLTAAVLEVLPDDSADTASRLDGTSGPSAGGVATQPGGLAVTLVTATDTGPKRTPAPSSGPYRAYAADARPNEVWLHEMLDESIPALDFPGDAQLSEVLTALADYFTDQHSTDDDELQMTIWPDLAELELEGINSLDEITVRGVVIPKGMSLKNALTLIFDQTDEPALTYVIQNEVMLITTASKAESSECMTTRVYNVGDLHGLDYDKATVFEVPRSGSGLFAVQDLGGYSGNLGNLRAPNDANQSQPGESPVLHDAQAPQQSSLADFVIAMTPQLNWINVSGDGGSVWIVGRSLVVRQSSAGHAAISSLLNQLAAANEE
ncbi:MAG: sigma-70 family RNA polymerase sigma factor [Planctomycetaceae bacterium]